MKRGSAHSPWFSCALSASSTSSTGAAEADRRRFEDNSNDNNKIFDDDGDDPGQVLLPGGGGPILEGPPFMIPPLRMAGERKEGDRFVPPSMAFAEERGALFPPTSVAAASRL